MQRPDANRLQEFLSGAKDIHDDPEFIKSLPLGQAYLDNLAFIDDFRRGGAAPEKELTIDDWPPTDKDYGDYFMPAVESLGAELHVACRASDARVRDICDAHARAPRPRYRPPPGAPARPNAPPRPLQATRVERMLQQHEERLLAYRDRARDGDSPSPYRRDASGRDMVLGSDSGEQDSEVAGKADSYRCATLVP